MKVVILAGGLGSRLSEETVSRPKPMVEISNKPIIWHIMNIYSYYGFNEFIICCGYKGHIIKEYFLNYSLYNSNVEIDLETNKLMMLKNQTEKWKIKLIDTGKKSNTGGRIKRIEEYLTKSEPFFLTYGDGLANINLNELLQNHIDSKKKATVTAVRPLGRFGSMTIDDQMNVTSFKEKQDFQNSRINGGFFVLNFDVLNYIKDDYTIFEKEPLENLSKDNQLNAYIHNGFWHPMDTLRDKIFLENLYNSNKAKWKLWKD